MTSARAEAMGTYGHDMAAQHLARRAALLADPTRATICLALLDGRAWTATEIAQHAGVALSTASEHLSMLVSGGMLAESRQGRHRYLRLAGPEVAQLLEDLAGPPEPSVGLRKVRVAQRLAAARTCYDHLAGDLGVDIHRALLERGLLSAGGVTDTGHDWFAELLGPRALEPGTNRPLARQCLDWTRRAPHLGGVLGAALASHFIDQRWVIRSATDRSVTVSPSGQQALLGLLDLDAAGTRNPG